MTEFPKSVLMLTLEQLIKKLFEKLLKYLMFWGWGNFFFFFLAVIYVYKFIHSQEQKLILYLILL